MPSAPPCLSAETNARQIPFRQQTSFQPRLRKARRIGASDSWELRARYRRARPPQSSAAQKLPYRQSGLRASRLQSSAAPREEQGLLSGKPSASRSSETLLGNAE